MAFTSSSVIDVRATGADDQGGMFDPGGCTFATDLAATSGNTASPVVTSASYNFVAGDVGAWVYVASGSGWTSGWFQIASVASNAATLSAAIGAGIRNGSAATNTAAGVANVASPTGGSWTIDYSQQDSRQFAFTDAVIDATTNTKFTSAAHPVGPNFVGNVVNWTAGTGWTVQRAQVLSVSGTVATCDKALGTTSSTGGTGKIGGALLSPAIAFSYNVAGTQIFVKGNGSTAYTMSGTINTAGGPLSSLVSGIVNHACRLTGWNTQRLLDNTDATRPIFRTNASTITLLDTVSTTSWVVQNIVFDGNANQTASRGVLMGGSSSKWIFERCDFSNHANNGLTATGMATAKKCRFFGCTGNALSGNGYFHGCEFYTGTATAFNCIGTSVLDDCLFYSQNGGSVDHITVGNSAFNYLRIHKCVFYGAGTTRTGINFANNQIQPAYISRCVFTQHTAYGIAVANTLDNLYIEDCAFWSNTTADIQTANVPASHITGSVTLTADPFTNAAGGDFSPNDTIGGGRLLKYISRTWPSATTIGYPEIGVEGKRGLFILPGFTGGTDG